MEPYTILAIIKVKCKIYMEHQQQRLNLKVNEKIKKTINNVH
jgi:hypothetical protein